MPVRRLRSQRSKLRTRIKGNEIRMLFSKINWLSVTGAKRSHWTGKDFFGSFYIFEKRTRRNIILRYNLLEELMINSQ